MERGGEANVAVVAVVVVTVVAWWRGGGGVAGTSSQPVAALDHRDQLLELQDHEQWLALRST